MKPRKGNRLGIMKAFIYVNACLYQLIEIPQAYPNECSEMEISERTSYGQAESLPEKIVPAAARPGPANGGNVAATGVFPMQGRQYLRRAQRPAPASGQIS
ncbi:hypothetical protein M513_10665 [Trichuris suis]|uniref:Uncharacterized protein n=1 Tax=Trichuris suis TaxID=68888 RepID=A0A085LU01_9BILA|nr:hypothetical protein M513_10665 [Trichuris suis]